MSKTFKADKPCKKCGNFERYLNEKRCVACAKNKANKGYKLQTDLGVRTINKKNREAALKNGDSKYLSLRKCKHDDCTANNEFLIHNGYWRYVANNDCCACNLSRVNKQKLVKKNTEEMSILEYDLCFQLYSKSLFNKVEHISNENADTLKAAISHWKKEMFSQLDKENKHKKNILKSIVKKVSESKIENPKLRRLSFGIGIQLDN